MNTKSLPKDLRDVRARDVMKKDVLLVNQGETVRRLVETLVNNEIWGAPVVDNYGALVGVVSMTDVLREEKSAIHDGVNPFYMEYVPEMDTWREFNPSERDLSELRVHNLMSTDLITAPPEATLFEVAGLMAENNVHRVIVVSEEGEGMVGLVTTMDIIQALAVRR